jgi:hypothetical protein
MLKFPCNCNIWKDSYENEIPFCDHSSSSILKHPFIRFTSFDTRKTEQDILLSLSDCTPIPVKGSILVLYSVACQEEALHRHCYGR